MIYFVLSSLLALSFAADAGAGSRAIPLALSACRLEHPVRLTGVAAECGSLSVAENPQDVASRRIALHIARVPAVSRRKRADPLFVLAGGPGMAASAFYAMAAPAFERIHRDRDIVLVDQRGTGKSNVLSCELNDDALYSATEAEIDLDDGEAWNEVKTASASVQCYSIGEWEAQARRQLQVAHFNRENWGGGTPPPVTPPDAAVVLSDRLVGQTLLVTNGDSATFPLSIQTIAFSRIPVLVQRPFEIHPAKPCHAHR